MGIHQLSAVFDVCHSLGIVHLECSLHSTCCYVASSLADTQNCNQTACQIVALRFESLLGTPWPAAMSVV